MNLVYERRYCENAKEEENLQGRSTSRGGKVVSHRRQNSFLDGEEGCEKRICAISRRLLSDRQDCRLGASIWCSTVSGFVLLSIHRTYSLIVLQPMPQESQFYHFCSP